MPSGSSASKLDALPGLAHAKALVRRLLDGRVAPHAVLFTGLEGAGAEPLAEILAQAWLCPNQGCGECRICRALANGASVDCQIFRPTGLSSLIPKSWISSRSVSSAMDESAQTSVVPVDTFLRAGPISAAYKVMVIHRADRMTLDAQNSLLKTLEEPNSFAKLILTTYEFARLLPTIRSRCLNVACELCSAAELEEKFPGASSDEIRFAEGSPGLLEMVRAHPKPYASLASLLHDSLGATRGEALWFSQQSRKVADSLAKALDLGVRAAHVEVLRASAAWFAEESSPNAERLAALAEAHRRVQGNVNASLAFDALWARLLQLPSGVGKVRI